MSAYSGHKDFFDADSGIWIDKTTSTVITFADGKKVFERNGDQWTNGHHLDSFRQLEKGDGIIYKWIVDLLNAGDTYHIICLGGTTTPDYSAGGYGVYFYPDGGVKAHGQNYGGITGCTAFNLSETLSQDDEIFIRWTCDAVTGFVDVHVKGGPWADWTLAVLGGSDFSSGNGSGYGNWNFFHGMYSSTSDCSVDEYQQYDSGGPDDEVPPNDPPVVDAGTDQAINFPAGATLDGDVTDDGVPIAAVLTWTKVSGPGTVSFTDAHIANPVATFSVAGTYVLRLTADDGELSDSDDVEIVVNDPPQVEAGPDQSVEFDEDASEGVAQMAATVTDDGVPVSPGSYTLLWEKLAGPGSVVFDDDTIEDPEVTFDARGVYTLKLTADDGDATASDTVTIRVGPQSVMPLAVRYKSMSGGLR